MADSSDFMIIGRVVKAHGVQGLVLVHSLSDVGGRFENLKGAYLRDRTGRRRWYAVESVADHQARYLIKLAGVDDRDLASSLVGAAFELTTDQSPPLDDGEYYDHQIIGIRVECEDGRQLGYLDHIIETGANDVFVVRDSQGRESLLPGTPEVILKVDIAGGSMTVRPLPGLLDEVPGGKS